MARHDDTSDSAPLLLSAEDLARLVELAEGYKLRALLLKPADAPEPPGGAEGAAPPPDARAR